MNIADRPAGPSEDRGVSSLKGFVAKLRKRHIVETLAAFIGGGWLLVEVVERLLVSHYHLPEGLIDLTVVSIVGALLATLVWRWFRSSEKRPGNIKVEVLFAPLIILATAAVDLSLLLEIMGIRGKALLVGAASAGLGIAWVVLKSLQWAAAVPPASPEPVKTPIEPSSAASTPPDKSIAVLPFKNFSSEEGQDYFCDGMTEELITKLSKVRSLRVISRTSAFMFKDTPKDARSIAQDLNVVYVLEGSVRRAGNKLRITAQLIDATADAHLWADTFDGILDDVFDFQDNVARAIVETLRLKLTAPEERQIAQRPIPDIVAHDFFLRARDAMYRTFTAEAIDDAIGFLESGLKITGDNALLLATLANVYLQAVRVWAKEEDDLARAEDYAQRALRLDPGMAQAYTVEGWIQWLRGNPADYARLAKRGLALDPNNVESVMWAFFLFVGTGRTAKALELTGRMIELDPIHPFRFFYPSVVHAFEGRFDRAIDELRRQVPPAVLEQPNWLSWTGWWLLLAGRLDEAKAALEPYGRSTAPGIYVWIPRILWLALSGQKRRLDEETSGKSGERAKHDSFVSCMVADAYAMLDDVEKAVAWLETAVDHGFINYPYLSQHDPMLAKLRDEPHFRKLLERVKSEWERFEA